MNRSYTYLVLGLILFAGFSSMPDLHGQRTLGTISGTITDETQAVLPGVSLSVTNLDTGITREGVTGDEGRYRVPNLPLGTYELGASLPDFQTSVRSGIVLTVGREAIVHFTLSVGEISKQVMVTGDASLVETTRADLTDLVDQAQIRDRPLNGRSFTYLTFLQPGVISTSRNRSTYSSTGGGGSQLSIAGARVMLTSFLMDGTNIKDQMGVTPANAAGNMLGVESVREFSVMATNYSAEFGGAGGVVSAVTKSGTNEFHGSVFEFHRNDNLDANEYFALKLFD
ncbi:MAG: carboxypeptidase regulatory-like domain-containing protein [Acidobacteria bacterium]|nr:carboxypeptidase regulatory-like domain-containing protein [Acidobacteriota bacterium]